MDHAHSPFAQATPQRDVPHPPDGKFDWLCKTPTHDEWTIGEENADVLPSQLEALMASASTNSLTVPAVFAKFIAESSLHEHLRSANGDYLSVAESVLPFADGFLVRFLHDQQGGAFWYLYTNADGSDHCVVSSYEYFDPDDMDYELDEFKASDFAYWSPSFEEFFCQYWIAHEMMFSRNDATPPPDVDPRFHELYAD